MAQLIKLHDYISRYEWNMYRYPSQYIRLKQENWQSLYNEWISGEILEEQADNNHYNDEQTKFDKIKGLFVKPNQLEDAAETGNLVIETELELRQYFLDKLLPFQIKWATSTITNTSILDQDYKEDETLKYFLQRFPDIYLIMYYPVFNIRNTPIDGEIIIIGPSYIEVITLIELEPNITIVAGDERRWTLENKNDVNQVISPLISLRRTEHVIKSILKNRSIEFPIKRTIISRTNPIVFNTEPFNTRIFGELEYNQWFNQKRNISAPLKNQQLRVAEALLEFCISASVKRPEWDNDHDAFTMGE